MNSLNETEADEIAKLCLEFYEKKIVCKSKPKDNEWTNLAAILQKGIYYK